MRTSIELTNEQRAGLLSVAGKRGLRGYSLLVQEAIAQYLHLPPPKSPSRGQVKRGKRQAKSTLMAFLTDGFSTGRLDGSEDHDKYVYRAK